MKARRHGQTVTAVTVALLVAGSACSGGDGSPSGGSDPIDASPPITTVESSTVESSTAPPAADVPPEADSSSLMAVLGPPDVFRRELRSLDGQNVLVETYTYAEIAQRFDLVGGLVVGNEAIEPFPDGTLLPLQYHVNDLWPGSGSTDLETILEQIEFTEVDAAALGLPAGTTVLAAPQLVVGLLDDVVVYAETFALVPDEAGAFEAYVEGSEP